MGRATPAGRMPLPPRLIAPLAGILGGAVGTTFGTMASIFFAIYFDAIRPPGNTSAPPCRR